MTHGRERSPTDPLPMLEMQGICKRYGAVRANERIDLSVARGPDRRACWVKTDRAKAP